MKEYLENKLFIGFLIFVGTMTYFVGINNKDVPEEPKEEIVEVGTYCSGCF